MLKTKLKIIVIFIMVVFVVFVYYQKPETETKVIFIAGGQSVSVSVEVADEPGEWETGLMFRERLPENHGMLFVFPDERERRFWMKNTLIPLDMVFVSSNLTIIHIVENAQPCKKDPCRIYGSNGNAQYVIEVNSGFCKKHKIRKGNTIEIRPKAL